MSLKPKIIRNVFENQEGQGFEIDMELISKIKKMMAGQSKDKKEFLKAIFKVYDLSLKYFDEHCFNNLTRLLDCREVEKLVLALKYKEGLNYKEKSKLVLEATKDFSVEYFFTLDAIVHTYWNDLTNSEYKISNLPNLKKNYGYDDIDIDLLFQQLALLLNTMTLIRCVKYDYYKSNITSVDDNYKINKSITMNKITASSKHVFMVGDIDKVKNEDIYDCVKSIGKVYNFDQAVAYVVNFIGCISTDEITEDIYSKIVLKSEYMSTVSNRIDNTSDVHYVTLNMDDFLRRKVLLPKKGVVLLVKDNPCIESILLKEKLGTYYNNLIIVTKYKNGREMINTLMIKDWKLSTNNRLLNVYKIETETNCPTTADYVSSFFELYNEDTYKYKPEYEVIAPYYWKYRNKDYKSSNDEVDSRGFVVRREYSVDIAPFIRKIGGEPSEESKELASKLGVILEDGYTIVKAHTRIYNKQ